MGNKGIIIKGNKDGLNIIINMDMFNGFEDMLALLIEKLLKGKQFYKESTLYIRMELSVLSSEEITKLREILFEEIAVKEIIFEDINNTDSEENSNKELDFTGIHEGRTKFIRRAIRGGQRIDYPGNIVIIGDVNSGAEVYAGGNIIVVGSIKGNVFAGVSKNRDAIIAAYSLEPEVLKIGDLMAISPDSEKPEYPEIAKVKDNVIIVEPYLNNKYI